MLTNKVVRTVLIVILLVSNFGCDQMSKSMVRNSISHDQRIHFFDRHFMLTRVENGGAFLSMGNDLSAEIKFVLLILVPVIALFMALMYLLFKDNLSRSLFIGLGFIVGGGIGNIYDRFIYGTVTDFLHVDFYLFRTGIFNMADVSIMTGVFIVVIAYMLKITKPADELPSNIA
jgi:signal peptidase II